MTSPVGSFVWYELMSEDADAAQRFYGEVIGWTFGAGEAGAPVDYRHIVRNDGAGAGGVLQLTPDMIAHGAHTTWMPYLHVADVDVAVTAIEADGGRVLMPRMDIDVGSFAMLTDPFGTPFYVMKPVPPAGQPDAQSTAFLADGLQAVRWNELASPDLAGAKAFYSKHFGFEFNNAMPMGPLGDYCFIEHGGQTLGAIMQRHDETRPPLWMMYFGVPSATAAKAAIEAAGGTALNGPHEVPGGDWVVQARDPQGAMFGVVGPKGE